MIEDFMYSSTAGMYMDLEGFKVDRTPVDYPYSYSFYVTYSSFNKLSELESTVYSDRLKQWDPPRYSRLCKKHFGGDGNCWMDRSPDTIEAFLQDYNDESNLELQAIMQGCNVSTGYPLWSFHYRIKKEITL